MNFNITGLLLFSLIAFSSTANAAPAEFPIARLKGLFTYAENFHVPQIRRAETVNVSTKEGSTRVEELRSEGYTCIHKNQTTRLCSKMWTPSEPPEGLAASVHRFMKPITLEFEGAANAPVLIHDGSTTQEWQVNEKIKVMQTGLSVYRVVKNNKEQVFIVFPVNESQPMTPVLFHNEKKLGLSIIANSKDTPTSTIAYKIEAFLEKE